MTSLSLVELGPLPEPLRARAFVRPKLCVAIPVFDEEAVLLETYRRLTEILDGLDVDWMLLFVNDGSRDATPVLLETLFQRDERVAYISLSRNFGHQGALTAALDNADGDLVISMDADLQHPPELLPLMIDAWKRGYDVVHTQKTRTIGRPRREVFAARFAYRLVRQIVGAQIIPHASDFRLLDRRALDAVRSLPERGRLYRGLTTWIGFRQCLLPYVAPPRAGGKSHYLFAQRLSVVTRELFDFSNVPLYVGLIFGGAALAFSLLYLGFITVWFLSAAATGEERPPGWASLISVTLVLSSVSLIFLGIIGVYVARIYAEVRGRPSYLVNTRRVRSDRQTG